MNRLGETVPSVSGCATSWRRWSVTAWVLAAVSVNAAPPEYVLEVFPPALGFDSAFPLGINEDSMILGFTAAGPWEPLTRPLTITEPGDVIELPALDAAYNFAYGASEAGLVVGISDLRPTVWMDPRLLILDVGPGSTRAGAGSLPEGGSHGRLSDGRSPCRHVLTCGDRSDE